MIRLGLIVTLAAVFPFGSVAWAQDDDEEEDEGDDEDEEEEDEEEEDDEEQPPVTAGGLFTKKTYPQAEIERPLTITRSMKEARVGIDMDMSNEGAFETWGLALDGRYGLEDNVELQLGVRTQLNNFDDADAAASNDLRITAALEMSIVYDLVDWRVGLAVPHTTSTISAGTPPVETTNSATGFDVELGFPFRYAPKPQVAVIALDTFMTFNILNPEPDVEGVENDGQKPDFTPSVGIIVQPVPMLAIKLHGKFIVPNFNFDADAFVIPVSANIQFSPKNLIDIGAEFTFPNLKPPPTIDPMTMMEVETKFYDSRFLLLYGQFRF